LLILYINKKMELDVLIIGGGLAGLSASIILAQNGLQVCVIEKGTYPQHRVCGEYVSNEIWDFLHKEGWLPHPESIPKIDSFCFSAVSGKSFTIGLKQGGFGLSRYAFDMHLYNKALSEGVTIKTQMQVVDILFYDDVFEIDLSDNSELTANLVIGAHGKKSKIDTTLQRSFLQEDAPFIGVKYHVKANFPRNLVALHNYEGGYCGLGAIENNLTNICYLGLRSDLRKYGSIKEMEEALLYKNPHIKQIFSEAEFVLDKPEVINAFSFSPKSKVENHVLMAGDSAGLITPLCGNGMAIAIRSGKMVADCIMAHYPGNGNWRRQLEADYVKKWNREFRFRLWAGKNIQTLFGHKVPSELMAHLPRLAQWMVPLTHGKKLV
jgi:flavin-dependent dehydrogenase